MTVGFIGQGFIGKNYADDFEARGHTVVRYALEEPYVQNANAIRECDIVFIAVPTPTTPEGFSTEILEEALMHVGQGKIAVIKSTVLPGTTQRLQEKHPDLTLLMSPEFLSEATAAYDAAHPFSNIVGLPVKDETHQKAAEAVHALLPAAPYATTCTSDQAELIKYAHNVSGYTQIVTFNMLYELSQSLGADWALIEKALDADPMISKRYAHPLHRSGRGAGGHCFIKDFAALRGLYAEKVNDPIGQAALAAFEKKNVELLRSTKKDLDLLRGVYGDDALSA